MGIRLTPAQAEAFFKQINRPMPDDVRAACDFIRGEAPKKRAQLGKVVQGPWPQRVQVDTPARLSDAPSAHDYLVFFSVHLGVGLCFLGLIFWILRALF